MNPFRHLLKARGARAPTGTWISSASPLVAEALGHAGFDWGVVDMEHAPADLMEVVHLLQAVGNTKMVPVVRVPWNDAVIVKRVLDAGAQTVLFPFVQDASEAVRAVAATRYPPEGVRGVAGSTRATRFGRVSGYATRAHEEVCLLVQLETKDALQHLEAIAALDGIDGIFIGPADLHASLGHAGEIAHPQVWPLIEDAIGRIRAAGKAPGILMVDEKLAQRCIELGTLFTAVGSDVGMLARGADALAARFHKARG